MGGDTPRTDVGQLGVFATVPRLVVDLLRPKQFVHSVHD